MNHKLATTRRTVLGATLATFSWPSWAQSLPSNPDVVVVGAGSAGLAAASTLRENGLDVVILEAAGRIGGRAFTNTTTFGVPFDEGCAWLHHADRNPYTAMAEAWGYETLYHDAYDETMLVGNSEPNAEQWDHYGTAWRGINQALVQAGQEGLDVAASTVVDNAMPWSTVCQTWIGPMSMGVDFKDLSTRDYWSADGTSPNYRIKEGFGTLVARYGEGAPVTLNAPVSTIDWSGDGVTVESTAGTVRAKACIVTVSTGVLGAGSIRFTPELPAWKQESIDNVPMGLLAKIPLLMDGDRLGVRPNDWLAYWVPNEPLPAEACYFLAWPFDTDLLIGFVGGDFGFDLSDAGAEAAVDFAIGELVKLFGSDVQKAVKKSGFTDWANDPWTRGGYASARPGHAAARDDLARAVGDRVYFAGEAVAGPFVQTCGGAFLSGQQVAGDVAKHLAG